MPADRDALAPEGSGDPRFRGREPLPCPLRLDEHHAAVRARATRSPAAARRRGRSGGSPPSGSGRTCGSRSIVANSVITSSRRRSNAAGSAGQRGAMTRFQNGSASFGSWRSQPSPRSRSSRDGACCARASWSTSLRASSGSSIRTAPTAKPYGVERRVALSWRTSDADGGNAHASHPSRRIGGRRLAPARRLLGGGRHRPPTANPARVRRHVGDRDALRRCREPAAGTAADVDATVSGNTWSPVSRLGRRGDHLVER